MPCFMACAFLYYSIKNDETFIAINTSDTRSLIFDLLIHFLAFLAHKIIEADENTCFYYL